MVTISVYENDTIIQMRCLINPCFITIWLSGEVYRLIKMSQLATLYVLTSVSDHDHMRKRWLIYLP